MTSIRIEPPAPKRRVLWALVLLAVAAIVWWMWPRDANAPAMDTAAHPAGDLSANAGPVGATPRRESNPVRTATLSGTVTTAGAGPLAGATVCATADRFALSSVLARDPSCTRTDAGGRYRIEGLLASRWAVTAHAARHVPRRWRDDRGRDAVALAHGQHRDGIDLALAPGGVAVRGTVEDGTGGQIEGAWVTATAGTWPRMGGIRAVGWPVRSDAEGDFEVWVAPGETEVWAEADGYAPASRAASAPSEGIVLRLYPEAVIEGVALRVSDGSPVPDALVAVGAGTRSARAYTDEAGRFRIDRLAPDRYSLGASTDDAHGHVAGIVVRMGETAEVTVRMHPAAVVVGRVIDETTDEPCESGGVTLVADDGDPAGGGAIEGYGSVRIRGVRAGRYRVMLQCVGKLPPQDPPELVVADAPVPEQTWHVLPGTSLAGVVVDDEGTPVAEASISAVPTGEDARQQSARGEAVSDLDGRFRIDGLMAGLYRVEPGRGARKGEGVDVQLPPGGLSDARLVLARAARIAGHVRDGAGKPLADAQVMAIPLGTIEGSGGRTFTNVDGAYTVGELAAGRYQLHAEGMDDGAGPTIDVAAGDTATVDLAAPARDRSIDGRVVDTHGSPVPDVAVSAIRERYSAWAYRDIPWVATDAEGRFELRGLAEGHHRVTATRGDTIEGELQGVEAGETVEIVLQPLASVAGTVAMAGGGVPPRFTLRLQGAAFVHQRFEHPEGRWSIDALAPGSYEIVATADEGTGSASVQLDAGATERDVAIEIAERGSVTGIVADGETGAPLVGMVVQATDTSGTSTWRSTDALARGRVTDIEGRFEIDAGPGAIALQVRSSQRDVGFIELQHPVTVPAGGHVDVGTLALPHMRLRPGDARGWFGFRWTAPPGPLDGEDGVRVTEVVRSSPMRAAGFAVGDEIVAVDGTSVRGGAWPNMHALLAVPPGTAVSFRLADAREIEVTAATASP